MTAPSLQHPALALPTPATPTLTTRVLDPRALSAADLLAWQALEARAAEPNAYLSPHFVLPALRHLDPAAQVHLVTAEVGGASSPRLVGLALVQARGPRRALPLPHLVSYRSRHSYLDHWLLDRDHPTEAAEALLRALRRHFPWAAAVCMDLCPLDGPQARSMSQAAGRLGQPVMNSASFSRAVLRPDQAGAHTLRERLGAKQHANQARCRRRLQEQGALTWAVLRGEVDDHTLEHFLALEHQGWKRDAGSSLRSDPADEAFFVEMARGFAGEGRAFFTELRLDGQPIASTANFISGDTGFAFKVGWDERLRTCGVGLLNEIELVSAAPQCCADLRLIDSGAQPASFIDALWPQRRVLAAVQVPLHRVGRWTLAAVEQLRRGRHAARGGDALGQEDVR